MHNLSGKIIITDLHQFFPAISTNSFESHSLNYDPDMFYLLNTMLPPSSFVEIFTMAVRKFSDV